MNTNLIAAIAASALLAMPLAALAQDVPSYASGGSYGDDSQIRGRIANFDGGYNLQVRDDKGYVDNVQLHQGTIINPTGLTLAPGMVVSIIGYNEGSDFAANEIDTPYAYDAGIPYYYGHPWDYYGPSIGLSFFFGNAGWWHGSDFSGDYAYERGVRVYNNVNVRNIYRGGSFRGRTYIAPPSSGGYVRGGYAHGGNSQRGNGQGGYGQGGYGGRTGYTQGGSTQGTYQPRHSVIVNDGNPINVNNTTTTVQNHPYVGHYTQQNDSIRPAYTQQNNSVRPAYPQQIDARPAYSQQNARSGYTPRNNAPAQSGNVQRQMGAPRQVSAPRPASDGGNRGGSGAQRPAGDNGEHRH